MRRYNQLYKLAFALFAVAAFPSCKKSNGIDNNTVIKKPYGLFIGAKEGAFLNTNDGVNFTTLFSTDDFPYRAIITSGDNILFVKANVHLSEDNGNIFNPSYKSFTPRLDSVDWQSMILNVEDHGRIYLSSIDPATKGIVYSEDNGKKWKPDNEWDDNAMGGRISSFAQLRNGALFAYSDDKDSLYRRDNKDDKWSQAQPNVKQPTGLSFLTRFNNTLILTDRLGVEAVQYSSDSGKTWKKYPGLPVRPLYGTNAPFDKVLLVGVDSMGVYRLENDKFVASNNGLESYTTVYAIAGKDDIYKNGLEKRYIYIATNKGLYRSEDLGFSWALVLEGDFRALH